MSFLSLDVESLKEERLKSQFVMDKKNQKHFFLIIVLKSFILKEFFKNDK